MFRRDSLNAPLLLTFSGVLAERPLLTALTVLAIAAAVTLATALEMSSRSANELMDSTIKAMAGRSEVEIIGGGLGVPEVLLDEIRRLPGVLVAEPTISESFVAKTKGEKFHLHVIGTDFLSETSVREYSIESDRVYVSDPLRLLADPHAVVIGGALSERLGLDTGDLLPVEWVGEVVDLKVRGIVRRGSLASAYNGQVALMDVYSLQTLLGREGRFDRIDVISDPSVEVDRLQSDLRALVSGRASVRLTSFHELFDERVAPLRSAIVILVGLGIVVSALLSYSAFSLMVERRIAELAMVRAIGLNNRGLVYLVLVEAILVSGLATALGIGLGIPAAAAAAAILSGASEYLQRVEIPLLEPTARTFLLGAAVGIVVGLAGVAQPLRRVTAMSPLDLLRPRTTTGLFSKQGPRTRALAVSVTLAAAFILAMLPRVISPVPRLVLLMVTGVGLVAVLVSIGLTTGLGWLRTWLEVLVPRVGRLVGATLTSDPYSSGTTAAILALLVGTIVTAITTLLSVAESIDARTVARYQHGAVYVATRPPAFGRPPVTAKVVAKIRAMPDVRDVAEYHLTTTVFRGEEVYLIAADYRTLGKYDGLEFVLPAGGSPDPAFGHGAVWITSLFSRHFGVSVGDEITLHTDEGATKFRVARVADGYGGGTGGIWFELSEFDRFWRRNGATWISVWPDVPKGFSSKLSERLAAYGPHFVMAGAEFGKQNGFRRQFSEQVGYIYLLMMIWAGIGAIGILTLLVGAVVERRRELALLRAAGATPSNLFSLVVLDGVLIAAMGSAAGTLLGWLWAHGTIVVLRDQYFWPIRFEFSLGTVTVATLAVLALATLLSCLPALEARRASVTSLIGR